MNHDFGNRTPYSFGETPSDRIRSIDHQSWWDIFMELVGTQPERPEITRLSDDPVHMVHGRLFSIRDCAMKAIDAAAAAGEDGTAASYMERAERLIRSYDRLAASRIRRFYDHRFTRAMITSACCLILAAIVAYLYFRQGQTSNGLLVVLILLGVTSIGCALSGAHSMQRKRFLLRLDQLFGSKPAEHNQPYDDKTKN